MTSEPEVTSAYQKPEEEAGLASSGPAMLGFFRLLPRNIRPSDCRDRQRGETADGLTGHV